MAKSLEEALVTSWVAGDIPYRASEGLACSVRRWAALREAYRSVVVGLANDRRVVARRGGPRTPELARRTKVLVLPHLGPRAALFAQEERGGGTAWHWPGAPVRRVAEGEPFVELGDEITGSLRIPVEYVEPSAVEDARLLERASDECASLARTRTAPHYVVHGRAFGLVRAFRSFEEELRRLARLGEAYTNDDADLAASLVSARLSLEEVLMELPDNGDLVQDLRELDEALADAGEVTLLVDSRDYEERIARVVPLPGRWWSWRAELDEVLPEHLLERLRARG